YSMRSLMRAISLCGTDSWTPSVLSRLIEGTGLEESRTLTWRPDMTQREIDSFNPKEMILNSTFEYGSARVKDLVYQARTLKNGRTEVVEVDVGGRPCKPTSRFWVSLQARFGFSRNIFRYFSHQEV